MKIDHAIVATRLDMSAPPRGTVLPIARRLLGKRLAFWVPVLGSAVLGTAFAVSSTQGVDAVVRWPLLGLLAINLLYLALTGVPALLGVLVHLFGRTLVTTAEPTGLSRTALLMPVHNEDPAAVFAAVEVMGRALADAGLMSVDMFVLSDTRDPQVAALEQAAFEALNARGVGGPALRYRRRPVNAGRKAGNLAEFCERWGDEYDYMLVLDADSLMGAPAIGTLIGLMDANPGVGIVQSVPYAVGRETLFARLQQFSARLYTPMLVEGLTFWQQGDGNYWGHNAIIRVAPFRAHCTLPVLPGREPWGGEILCHDVVEAGMMRGAGWDVWVLPQVMESYEAVPANLVDFASRERRWCQGNLQHKGVLPMPGFRPVGRFHLAYGIAHYAAGATLALFLGGVSIDAALGGGFGAALMQGPGAAGLIAVTAVLLYGGKLATLLVTLANGASSARFGGRWALLGGAVIEQVAAMVITPLLIVSYARYLVELVCGRSVRWDAQPRDDRGVSWHEAWLRSRLHVMVGLGWLALLPAMPMAPRVWALPLLLGLLATWPLTVWSSRVSLGALARRFRLLLTPEEAAPAPILRAYQRAVAGTPPVERARRAEPLLQPLLQAGETT